MLKDRRGGHDAAEHAHRTQPSPSSASRVTGWDCSWTTTAATRWSSTAATCRAGVRGDMVPRRGSGSSCWPTQRGAPARRAAAGDHRSPPGNARRGMIERYADLERRRWRARRRRISGCQRPQGGHAARASARRLCGRVRASGIRHLGGDARGRPARAHHHGFKTRSTTGTTTCSGAGGPHEAARADARAVRDGSRGRNLGAWPCRWSRTCRRPSFAQAARGDDARAFLEQFVGPTRWAASTGRSSLREDGVLQYVVLGRARDWSRCAARCSG